MTRRGDYYKHYPLTVRLVHVAGEGVREVYKRLDGKYDIAGVGLGLPASTLMGTNRIDVLYESARIVEV